MSEHSLTTRLLLAVSLLLLLFFGITIMVLDGVFRDASEQAMRDRLEIQVRVLMAAAEEQGQRLVPDAQLLDSRYLHPHSGLYGEIARGGVALWRSPSLPAALPVAPLKPGARRFNMQMLNNGTRVLSLNVGLSWQFDRGVTQDLVFVVAESREQYYAQLQRFRVRLFGGFAVMSLLLIVALAWLLRTVLRPLRRIEHEIENIEAGRATELSGGYPRELQGVTRNLNTLLGSERERMARYRDALGNLAHSLKTPLAVLRSQLASDELRALPAAQQIDAQTARMDDIVRYQLQRAAVAAGVAPGSAPVAILSVVEPLLGALQKVYMERHMNCEVAIAPACAFACDRQDLLELLGNLLDNAFKYGHTRLRIQAANEVLPDSQRSGLRVVVEDDGPGIAIEARQQVLQRGTRLDERTSGQGIGLSVVRELVQLYRGSIEIDRSALGGARVIVQLRGA